MDERRQRAWKSQVALENSKRAIEKDLKPPKKDENDEDGDDDFNFDE